MKNDCCTNHSLASAYFLISAGFAKLFTIKISLIENDACNTAVCKSSKQLRLCNTAMRVNIHAPAAYNNKPVTCSKEPLSYPKETGVCSKQTAVGSKTAFTGRSEVAAYQKEMAVDSVATAIDIRNNTILHSCNGHVQSLQYELTVVTIPPDNAVMSADSAAIAVDIRNNPILHFGNRHRQSLQYDLTSLKIRLTVKHSASTAVFLIPPSEKYDTTFLKKPATLKAA